MSTGAEQQEIATSVLVVGGGPVGLALAVGLDRHGVDCVVVERRAAPTEHPKSRGLTSRSMELLRVWGLDAEVRAGGLQPELSYVGAMGWVQHHCETIAGRVFGVTRPEMTSHSPAGKCAVAQDVVERVLSDAAGRAPRVDLRRGHEFLDIEVHETGVVARVRRLADGRTVRVRARYLVACDGASSVVRERVGVPTTGPGVLADMVSYYYRADTAHLPHAHTTSVFMVYPDDPTVQPGPVLASDPTAQRWLYLQRLESPEQPALTESELVRTARGHWGIPDLAVIPLKTIRWQIRAAAAATFRTGPVLLAGDAAHCVPPTGGLGLNTGLQDIQNLAWKLAAVANGIADDALLDTYDAERRPVAEAVLEWSVSNYRRLMVEAPVAAGSRTTDPQRWRRLIVDTDNHTHCEGMSMGYVYRSDAVVDDGSPLPAPDARHYWPTDRPGARFPHMWLDVGETASTIDWFDTEFVLVCGTEASAWSAAGEAYAGNGQIPLVVRTLPFMALPVDIGTDGAVLVRPDGHVAWRSLDATGASVEALTAVLDAVHGRGRADLVDAAPVRQPRPIQPPDVGRSTSSPREEFSSSTTLDRTQARRSS
ncbi:FAD-dependent monooxygenase [Amycolatopsis pithecellobii]|uniref:FAD-dependent monooxygenase n=1 Tax=Amycolatopsis pithecellobii TaxID=664692 RepID=UPI0012B91BC2|nr:FAD-dependent monooxygenase [Amycolatopsis pithecellobii]